jgi:heme-based aerotactic transducer
MGSEYGAGDFDQGGLTGQVDADELLTEIDVDQEEIAWRKDFLNFDQNDVERLTQYQNTVSEHAEEVAEDFYDNLTQYDQTTGVINRSPKSIEQLKRTQSAYLVTLVEGDYGIDYFRDRARIGKLHDILDMPMKQYLGQYGVYYDLILPLIGDRLIEDLTKRLAASESVSTDATEETQSPKVRPQSIDDLDAAIRSEVDEAVEDILAFLRIINLDMQLVTDTYIHSYSQELERELDRQQTVATEVDGAVGDAQRAADDIAESAERISDSAQSQVESMEDIASEVSDLSATIEEIAATADEVADTSKRAEKHADEGRETADQAIEVMDQLDATAEAVAEDIKELRERINEIDEVVEVIDDIAEQTNLLALNANIEAARADDAGDGFGVVANEVKDLAADSRQHASEIETLVTAIQAETEDTVENLDEATDEIDKGVAMVDDTVSKLQEIADAVEDAAVGIQEVSNATDDQAASTEEIASMVDEQVEQSAEVADRIEDIAAANEEQASKMRDIQETVDHLNSSGK